MQTPHSKIGLTLLALTLCTAFAEAVTLPQRHPYQQALRTYFETLAEKDFTVEREPVRFDEPFFSGTDQIARYWMLFATRNADIPDPSGIRVAPGLFTLSAIETEEGIRMNPGRGPFMDPKDTAWWTRWKYPGNPYYGCIPLKRRAFVAAAVDMMMQDEEHESGQNLRSDYLGGSMIRFGYTYFAVKDDLPKTACEAYAAGLIRMFEKLERLTPHGAGGSDMEFFQLVGLWYAAEALGEPFPERALARAQRVIREVTCKTGYERHGGAFDVSYQGIALRFLTWAAMLYKDPVIDEALNKMLILKSHLSLPEPDGTLFGPTHFNTGTAQDAPRDQWAWVSRDLAMAMLDDEALYTVKARLQTPSPDAMLSAIRNGMARLGVEKPSPAMPQLWRENHWVNTVNFAFDYYRPGFYDRLIKLEAADDARTRTPFARGGSFIRDLNGGGEFLAARFQKYGAVIHTGAIAKKWAEGVSGKSGGALSAFWTPTRGSAVLGRTRATQSQVFDEWDDTHGRGPYTWAVHAMTGIGSGGGYFSTARLRSINTTYDIQGPERAIVSVTGQLSGSRDADPQQMLSGDVAYRRVFDLDMNRLQILSELTFDEKIRIQELWEMIPVFLGDQRHHPKAPPAEIYIQVDGGWKPVTETAVETARVRLTRYGAAVTITLDHPRRVKRSPRFEDRSFGDASVCNLMIDLLADLPAASLRYEIAPDTQESER